MCSYGGWCRSSSATLAMTTMPAKKPRHCEVHPPSGSHNECDGNMVSGMAAGCSCAGGGEAPSSSAAQGGHGLVRQRTSLGARRRG